jgi:hypothetical protein
LGDPVFSDPDHSFDATISAYLPAGNYLVKVRSDGQTGEIGKYDLSVETGIAIWGAPILLAVSGDNGRPDDGLTNDNTLVLSGLAQPGATVKILRNGTEIDTTTAASTGSWSFDYTSTPLASGEHKFSVTDSAGTSAPERS